MDETPPDRIKILERELSQCRRAEAVFTHALSPLAILDADYTFVRANEAYARACRKEIGELIGRNFFEIYPLDVKRIFDQAVQTKQPSTGAASPFVFPDQPERGVTYWDWTVVPILGRQGEVDCLVLSLVEVTERQLAEEALRESEARHRQQAAELELIYRTAPIGLCVVNSELRFVHINQRLAEINGVPPEAHLGKTVREVVPRVAERIEPFLHRVLETGKPVLEFETTAETPAQPGVQRTWMSQYWPLKDDAGQILGINVVAEEITERRRLEEMRRREQEFRSLAENSADVVVRFDRSLRRIYANPAIESVLGRPPSEILGKTNREAGLPQALAESMDRRLEQVFCTGQPQTVEATLATPRGERTFDARLVPEFGPDGRVETVLAITRDITERKRAEAALAAYAEGQDFLVRTALRLLQPLERSELFDFVAERIHSRADGGIVLFNEFDPVNRRTILRALASTQDERAKAGRLFGRDPIGITLDFPESVRERMLPGELEHLAGGLCDLAFYQLPQALCDALERELEIKNVYAMACSVEQDLLGTVAVLTHAEGLPNKRLIESVVSEAALALKRKRVEEALRDERNFFDTVFDTQGAIVAILDRRYRVTRLNRAYYETAGFPPGSLIGRPFRHLMERASGKAVERQLDGLANRWAAGEFESLLHVRDGGTRVVSWRATVRRNEAGEIDYVVATGIDITERKQIEERTRHLAEHDALTDLPNRRLLLALLDAALQSARRSQRKVAVLFLDLDRFKAINDTLGHDAGDTLLKEVAHRLTGRVRRSDIVARLAGDEFTVLLGELVKGEQAGEVAGEILQTFHPPFQLAGQSLYVTTSVGISLYPDDDDNAEGLLRCADLAMYEAKTQGRNNYRFYNPVLHRRSQERAFIESRLRQALERGGLFLRYQPETDLRTGGIVAVEALVRWPHPELGLLDPERFIRVAEETGLIKALDDWTLHTACLQARQWLDQGLGPICVSVNLSAKRFESPDLVETVRDCLAESGLAPEHLELELTEHTVMHHIDQSIDQMRQLVGLGVGIAIDDFGTGYSSLNYLKQLPIRKLKIDRSFVRDIASDADDRAIIEAVIALAHTLNKRVIAEGVETEVQRAFLVESGCDEAQGFLFTEPLPPEEVTKLLRS